MAGYYERHKPEAWERAVEALDKGLGYGEASRQSGISTKGISNRYPGRGLPSGRRYPDRVRDEAARLLDEGVSYREVQATLGVSRHTVSDWYPERGWTAQEGGQFKSMLHYNSTVTLEIWDQNRRMRG